MGNTARCISIVTIILISLGFADILKAQHIWLDQERGSQVSVEYLKPSFSMFDYTFLSSTWFISGQFQIGNQAHLKLEIPLAHAEFSEDSFFLDSDLESSESMVGNPYVGFRYFTENNMIDFGMRLPLSSDDNFIVPGFATMSDPDRLEAFILIDLLTISGKIHRNHVISENFKLRWYGGPTVWIPTDDRDFIDDELLLDYAMISEFRQNSFSLNAGITGRVSVTQDVDDFSDRFIHQFGMNASYLTGNLQPGIHLRTPIQGDFKDILNHVFGLNLIYKL